MPSKAVIAKANTLYAEIIQIVNAYAIVQTTDTIDKFIDDLNGLVSLYARIGGASASGGSAPDGSNPGGEEERPGEL